tara:strand:+ start:2307 stop:4439 length:2133 start_codon:yes stop_codon:yes gene_type:complete
LSGKSDLKLLKRSVFTKAFSLVLKTGKPVFLGISLLASSFTIHAAFGFDNEEKPHRANDLAYGEVLYEYYQGNAFEALSFLNVAKVKGGIKGHGDHPDLVEGGLLLSYGMTQEAKAIFENLLKEKLSITEQNMAWFYLGKVFYLEQNYAESLDSFAKINTQELNDQDQEKFYELIYIKSQIASYGSNKESPVKGVVNNLGASINELPNNHIYHYYIRYNQAVSLLSESSNEAAIAALIKLSHDLSLERQDGQWRNPKEENATNDTNSSRVDVAMEFKALYNQTLLSLGQLYLQNNQNELAFNTLKQVDKDSVFSEQALFAYAIAASNLTRYELALAALNTLNEQRLFNPWQQQTPYALAYLYEQLNEPVLALEAYRAAVAQYETLQENLEQERQTFSEAALLETLNIKGIIGSEELAKDAYGRLLTPKQRFSFSKLLTTEAFQRQLSELHELYLLKNSMHCWAKQLDSFEDMLDTRLLSRQQKLKAIKTKLALQKVDQWTKREQTFKQAIDQAIADNNAYFFMTDEQMAYFSRLQKTQERLNTLPDEHKKKTQYTKRFERAKAYFDWWVRDELPVNRWRTLKELKALQAEMTLFRKQHALLDEEQELDDKHASFVTRVNKGRERLNYLSASLEESLAQSSKKLISQVDTAMQQQLVEIGQYLLASREALARVSDKLLVEGKIRYSNQDAIKQNTSETEQQKQAQTVEGDE